MFVETKVFLYIESILEEEHSILAWIFYIYGWNKWTENTIICKKAREIGFRSRGV